MAPLVMAALNEVPDPLKLASPTRPVGNWVSMVEPGARRLTTERPGTTRSGLNQPSAKVGPTLEKSVTVSSAVETVPWSSVAPAVMIIGSSPGLDTEPLPGPSLPAEATTVIPDLHAFCTALLSGAVVVDSAGLAPRERFNTLMPKASRFITAHWMPAMTVLL